MNRPSKQVGKSNLYLHTVKIFSLILFLSTWHMLATFNVDFGMQFSNMPTPLEVIIRLAELVTGFRLYFDIMQSLIRIISGFFLAMLLAIPLGIFAGTSRTVESILFPVTELLRPIPNIAWAPIVVLLFPQVEQSIVFITFIGAFFPILINTIVGVKNTPWKYINAGTTLGFSTIDTYKLVIIPSSLPYIFTGLKVGIGVSWLGLIIAEMISGRNGIGYYTWLGYQLVDYTQILTGILLIGVLSMMTTFIISEIERRILKWQTLINYG